MKVVPIDLSLVDFEDQSLHAGNIGNISSLKDSIEDIGLLNPPILRDKEGGYQVITGWKRLATCKEIGLKEVYCSVYPSDFSDKDCLKTIFVDNRDRISEIELGQLISLHKILCGLADKQLMDEVMPSFDIPSNRKNLDKYLALASLENEVKNAFFEEKITIEQCHMLSELPSKNRLQILENILLMYNLNNNESRQVIQHISEIASIKLKSILDIISEVESASPDRKLDKNHLRDELKRMRYPDLSDIEDKVRKTIQEIELPKEVNVHINQFFEANDIEIRIKAKSSEELLEICNNIIELCAKGDVDKLISLIKGGNNGFK